MAANAIERHAILRTKWLQLLASNPERLEFATRLALICSLTALVTGVYQTPDAALAVYFAFFLNRPERTVSLILSVAFPLIIAIVLALILLVANLVADDAMWRVISIVVISFGLLFLASASQLRPIAGTIAMVVGYALDLLGRIQTGELATRGLLYLALCVAIPGGVSFLVNLLLAPAPRRTVAQAIVDRLKLSAAVLRDTGSASRRELAALVREGMTPILKQLKLARIEKSATVQDLGALQQAALSTYALMSAVDALASSPEIELPSAVRLTLADTVEKMAHIVQQDGYPLGITLELPPEANLSPAARDLLAAIRHAVTRFAEPDAPAQTTHGKTQIPPSRKGGFWVEDAFTNPEHVHYALKATTAATFCYLLYSLLDWPGIHTCFLTCYIVAQITTAESVEKLSLRLIGCVIGAAAGIAAIVFLIPSLTSIGGLMIAVFVGAWAASYVAAGTARISYAGFQIAFAFFLCIIQGSGPALDLTIARDRIIGIIIGNLVAYFTFVYVRPATVSRRVDPGLATAFRQLAKVVSAQEPRERQLLASQAQGTLRQIETDIELAHYEPASIRSSAWLAARRHVVESSQSLGSLLLLSTDTRELSRVEAGPRLERLAMRLAGPTDAAAAAQSQVIESTHDWQTLPARVDGRLQALEGTLAASVVNSKGKH